MDNAQYWFQSGEASSHGISRSLRFNSADSASLSKAAYSGSGTFSCWVKRCKLGVVQAITAGVSFDAGDKLNGSTAVFRDPSAWMHIVTSTAGTYVNGVSVGSGTAITPSAIGSGCDLYLTEIHFIDGQALTPSSFGETDTTTGVWKPKKYAGTYGTNGFYLNFSDNSSVTTLGKDSSGNGNDWTPSNFSVTAGAGNDSLVDVPTQGGVDTGKGGEVRGNYATWSPIHVISGNTSRSFANGNLDYSVAVSEESGEASAVTTMPLPTTGKWYWEVTPTTVARLSAARTQIGVMGKAQINYTMAAANADCFGYTAAGGSVSKVTAGVFSSYGSSYTANDVIGVAVDLDNGAIYFAKNGTWQNSGVPTSGSAKTGAAFTTLVGANEYFPAAGYWGTFVANFGQRLFAYTAPSGFKALCTTNLPAGVITTSGTFTGNGVADGPLVYLNGVPTAMTINGNAVTFGTHVDKLANGFKVRTADANFNQNAASRSFTVTTVGPKFNVALAQPNP